MKSAELITVQIGTTPSFLVGAVSGLITEEGIEAIMSKTPEKYHGQILNVLEHQRFDKSNNSINFDICGESAIVFPHKENPLVEGLEEKQIVLGGAGNPKYFLNGK